MALSGNRVKGSHRQYYIVAVELALKPLSKHEDGVKGLEASKLKRYFRQSQFVANCHAILR